MMRNKLRVILGSIIAAWCFIGFGGEVNAASFSSIKTKAAYEGVYTCINNGTGAAAMAGEGLLAASFNASAGAEGFLLGKGSGAAVKLPFGLTDATDNNTNCKQVLFGFNADIDGDDLNKGLIPTNIQDTSDKSVLKNYFAGSDGMGYKAEAAGNVSSGQTTQQLKISFNSDYTDICRNSSGVLASPKFVDEETGEQFNELVFPTVTKDSSGNWWIGDNSSISVGTNVPEPGSGGSKFYRFCDGSAVSVIDNGSALSPYYTIYGSFVQYTENIYGGLDAGYIEINDIISAGDGSWNSFKCDASIGTVLKSTCINGTVEDSAEYDDWKFTWDDSYMTAIRKINSTTNTSYKLSQTSSYASLALSNQEVYDLYTYYIRDVFKVPVVCEGEANYELYADKPSINWKKGSSCKADTGSPGIVQYPGNVYGVDNTGTETTPEWHFTKEVTVDDVIAALAIIDVDELGDTIEGGTVDNPTADPGIESGVAGESEGDPCYNTGIESMSWILCPAANNMAEAVDGIDRLLDEWLEVPVDLYDGSGNDVETVWGYCRDIANILIIIILVVIIFSQLTGYGIDNYGIKRMLPRLIVMAILINLSFIICQIAIDLSNILGVGLNNLFQSIGRTTDSSITFQQIAAGLVTGLFAAVAAGGAVVGVAGTTGVTIAGLAGGGLGPMIVISVILVLLIALVAVVMFFLMLGARLIIILVFTAISPIAFACYILPNTQNLFKKWWDIFKVALLMYPICGALYGMSFVIRAMVFGTGEVHFWMAMLAVCAPFLPFLMLPSLLRSALAMLGKAGAAVTALGTGLRSGLSGANRALQNSESYKADVDQMRRAERRWRAGVDRDGLLTERGRRRMAAGRDRDGNLTKRGRRQAAYYAAARKDLGEDEQATASLTNALAREGIAEAAAIQDDIATAANGRATNLFEEHTEGAYYGRQFLDAANRGDISGMNAAIEAMRQSNMKPKDISKLMRYAERSGQYHFRGATPQAQANTRAAWYRDMAKRYGNDFMATDFELQNYAQMGGGNTAHPALGDYGDFAIGGGVGMDDIKPEDIGRLSSDSLAGLARSGGIINSTMAQRAIEASPNMSVDKKIMLSAIANGATVADIEAFKNEAKALMNANTASFAGGPMSIGGIDVTQAMRDAWAAVTPDAVNVVQNFHGGGTQFNPVDVRITHDVATPTVSPTAGPSTTGLTSTPTTGRPTPPTPPTPPNPPAP